MKIFILAAIISMAVAMNAPVEEETEALDAAQPEGKQYGGYGGWRPSRPSRPSYGYRPQPTYGYGRKKRETESEDLAPAQPEEIDSEGKQWGGYGGGYRPSRPSYGGGYRPSRPSWGYGK